jgi:hypothetical protein
MRSLPYREDQAAAGVTRGWQCQIRSIQWPKSLERGEREPTGGASLARAIQPELGGNQRERCLTFLRGRGGSQAHTTQ